MPRYLAEVGGKVCVWSSIVDAPVSPFMDSIEALEAYIRAQSPTEELFDWCWPDPSMRLTEAEVTDYNRAGAPGGSGETIGADELLERYYGESAYVRNTRFPPRLTEAEVVAFNRAGPDETCIGARELLERYR